MDRKSDGFPPMSTCNPSVTLHAISAFPMTPSGRLKDSVRQPIPKGCDTVAESKFSDSLFFDSSEGDVHMQSLQAILRGELPSCLSSRSVLAVRPILTRLVGLLALSADRFISAMEPKR